MNQIIIFALASILTLSGCFSSPSNGGNETKEKLNLLWEYAYDLDGGAPRARPLIHGSTVITSGDIKVTSLDYKTGELLWKTSFENTRQLLNRRFGLNENVLTGTIPNKMMAWDVRNGQHLWDIQFADSLNLTDRTGVGEVPTGFIAFSNGNRLFRIHRDGVFDIISTDARSYFVEYLDGILIVCQVKNMRGIVSAYQFDTMELLWRFEPGNYGYPAYTPPIVENGIVYVGTVSAPSDSEFGFFALNAATGQEIWRKEGIQSYSAVLHGDFLYVNDAGGVHKLRKDNGATVWYTNFGSSGTAPIAYGYGYIYAPHSGAMRILDTDTGEIVHIMSPPDGSFFWLVTADKGRIFAQTNRHLYAFAPWGHEEALE